MQVQGLVAIVSSTIPRARLRSAFSRQGAKSGLHSNAKYRLACPPCQTRVSHQRSLPCRNLAAGASGSSADDASEQPNSRKQNSEAQPSTSRLVPLLEPGEPNSRRGTANSSPQSSAPMQQYPVVSEGRRSASWEYKQGADKRSLWGTFIKGVALLVLGTAAGISQLKDFVGRAGQALKDLTYPKPGAILRLTCAVLLSSAALTLIVWGLDRGFSSVLLPPVQQKLSGVS